MFLLSFSLLHPQQLFLVDALFKDCVSPSWSQKRPGTPFIPNQEKVWSHLSWDNGPSLLPGGGMGVVLVPIVLIWG